MELDKETSEQLRAGSKVREFVRSEGWALVKAELTDRLVLLADITTLSDSDPVEMLREIQTRKLAISLVIGWFREVEGQASQQESNEEYFKKVMSDSIILRI